MPDRKRSVIVSMVGLAVLALTAAILLSLFWDRTAEQIALNERSYRLRALSEIVPPGRHDNNFFEDTVQLTDAELLGSATPVTAYLALQDGAPVAVILPVVAPNGYSASIRLLVGINYDGSIAGVRVSEHRETAGLGDKIEVQKSGWILSFDGRSIGDPVIERWKVRSDGGDFDQFTGATITPRAVVNAVRDALLYFEANRDLLFAATMQNAT